jgi:hypothetical protein
LDKKESIKEFQDRPKKSPFWLESIKRAMKKKLGSYEENHAMFNKVFIKGSRSQISINSESMKPTRPEKGLYTTYKLVQYCAKTFEP